MYNCHVMDYRSYSDHLVLLGLVSSYTMGGFHSYSAGARRRDNPD